MPGEEARMLAVVVAAVAEGGGSGEGRAAKMRAGESLRGEANCPTTPKEKEIW